MKISHKWYLFGKPECSAMGFWNVIGDNIIRGLMALDIVCLDQYGGPCIYFKKQQVLHLYVLIVESVIEKTDL